MFYIEKDPIIVGSQKELSTIHIRMNLNVMNIKQWLLGDYHIPIFSFKEGASLSLYFNKTNPVFKYQRGDLSIDYYMCRYKEYNTEVEINTLDNFDYSNNEMYDLYFSYMHIGNNNYMPYIALTNRRILLDYDIDRENAYILNLDDSYKELTFFSIYKDLSYQGVVERLEVSENLYSSFYRIKMMPNPKISITNQGNQLIDEVTSNLLNLNVIEVKDIEYSLYQQKSLIDLSYLPLELYITSQSYLATLLRLYYNNRIYAFLYYVDSEGIKYPIAIEKLTEKRFVSPHMVAQSDIVHVEGMKWSIIPNNKIKDYMPQHVMLGCRINSDKFLYKSYNLVEIRIDVEWSQTALNNSLNHLVNEGILLAQSVMPIEYELKYDNYLAFVIGK